MKKILIVVPWRRTVAYVWAIEHAKNLSSQGHTVLLLDLSKLEGFYRKHRIRWYWDLISVKNPAPVAMPKILQESGINIVKNKQKFVFNSHPSAHNWPYLEESMISQYALAHGDSTLRIQDIPKKIRRREKKAYQLVRKSVQETIKKFGVDEFVTINGRFVNQVSALMAARDLGVPTTMLETNGSSIERMSIFKISPQSISEHQSMMKKSWTNETEHSEDQKKRIAINLMNLRMSPEWVWRKNAHSSSNPIKGRYIAYFPASDHEFAVFDIDRSGPPHPNQYEILRIVCEYAQDRRIQVIVRGHPQVYSKHLAEAEDKIWQNQCTLHGATYIDSKSNVDSLKLAEGSYLNVITFSSIALEIGWKGLPLIITAPTIFSGLIPEVEALNAEKIREALANPPHIRNRDALLPYLYYEVNGGQKINHFKVYNKGERYLYIDSDFFLDDPRKFFIFLKKLIGTFRSPIISYIRSRKKHLYY